VNFLLDTNVVSEPMKPQPDANVMHWLSTADEACLFISVVTLTEVRYGAERLPKGKRRKELEDWLEYELQPRFEGRTLPVDSIVANTCGKLVARSESLGRPIEPRDAFIAATAETYGFTLVTHDISDFQPTLKSLLNPWISS
jgi:predicted nucleic acid-binding protein